ncbi:MAG: sigma-70 family RNA polymerase sigma factor [Bacteroidota bacterium]
MNQDIQQIIQQHKDKIFKTCLGFTNSREDAKDLVQEVLINIWLGLQKFRGEAQLSTWIYRVTVNTCLMHKRKKKVATAPLPDRDLEARESNAPEETDQKKLHLLRQFLQELPERDRLLMILYLENLTYQEIAEVIGLKANNVGVRINRIKTRLKRKFEAHG